jgi:winged helix DNA-binding protein
MAAASQIISARALNRATLARQMLLARERLEPATAIERIAGMQAQVPRPPFVGLWTRLEGFTRQDLLTAIERREVVRGTLMRGTIHLFSTRDYLKFRQTLVPALSEGLAVVRERIRDLDIPDVVERGRAFFTRAPAPFSAFRDHLKKASPGVDERALAYVVRLYLPLLQTPGPGAAWGYPATADFAVAESWLGKAIDTADRAEELACRYLAAFGPATPNDFRTWSGLPAARTIFEALRPKLIVLRDDRKRELFDLPKAPRPAEDVDAPVRFLPEFDNLLLAYTEKTRFVAEAHRSRLTTRNLLLPATFLIDGAVAGTWTLSKARQAATLTMSPFGRVSAGARKALDAEGARIAEFLDPDARTRDVVWQTASPGKAR